MRGLVQRVSGSEVLVGGEVVGSIGRGLLALVGVTHDDTSDEAQRLAEKIHHLRVFEDEGGAMNRSVADLGLEVLVVSQFTLYADTRRGRRPGFTDAARPEQAEPLVELVVDHLRGLGTDVATGRFRAHMEVRLVNDGPVTILLEV